MRLYAETTRERTPRHTAVTIGFRHTEYRRAPAENKTGGRQAGFVDTQYRRAPAGKTGEHRKGPAGVGEHRRQTIHLDPQNRGTGGRPSISRTKSVTRDTSTKVRYRGQRFTHAARSCLDARSQPHNPEPHRDGDTEFARNDEMNVRGHVDVTGSTAVISRRGRGMRWRRRGLGLRDSRNEQWL